MIYKTTAFANNSNTEKLEFRSQCQIFRFGDTSGAVSQQQPQQQAQQQPQQLATLAADAPPRDQLSEIQGTRLNPPEPQRAKPCLGKNSEMYSREASRYLAASPVGPSWVGASSHQDPSVLTATMARCVPFSSRHGLARCLLHCTWSPRFLHTPLPCWDGFSASV